MKKILSGLRGKTLLFLLLLATLLTQSSCHTTHKAWFNLNYVCKEGYDSATRSTIIDSIKRQIGLVSSGIAQSSVYNPAFWRGNAPEVYTNGRKASNAQIE